MDCNRNLGLKLEVETCRSACGEFVPTPINPVDSTNRLKVGAPAWIRIGVVPAMISTMSKLTSSAQIFQEYVGAAVSKKNSSGDGSEIDRSWAVANEPEIMTAISPHAARML